MKLKFGAGWVVDVEMKRPSLELQLDIKAGADCLTRASNSSWWEWSDGSHLFFWHWPVGFCDATQDGIKMWVHGNSPH